jgi:branched-subunit amino acid ABC-type transport system permease component
MIFRAMRVVNFAQGEFRMLGMYRSAFAARQIGWTGLVGPTLETYAGLFLAIPVIFALRALVPRRLLSL